MQLLSLPIRYRDETLYSVVARIRLKNAAKDDRDACRCLFGHSRNTRVSDFPVDLKYFCDVTKGIFGTAEEVLTEMTLYGFFDSVGSHPWKEGSANLPMASAGHGLATLSNGSANNWRACSQCIASDMAHYGTSYWRRGHHLPGAFLCPIHDAPLEARILPIPDRHNRFFLPDETNARQIQRPLYFETNYKTLMRLTKLGIDILDDGWQPVTSQTVYSTLFSAFGERDLLTPSGLIRKERFTREILNSYNSLRRHPDFFNALSPRGLDILLRKLVQPGAIRSAAHNLLLIDRFFGTWQSFKDHCLWQAIMDSGNAVSESENRAGGKCRFRTPSFDLNKTQFFERQQHRRTCLDFLEQYEHPMRSKFSRGAPKSLRWLLRYDLEWLNANLPISRRMLNQHELF